MVDIAAEELEKAHDTLSDVVAIREAAVTDETVVNRLYYPCFHAAQAVLYANGFEPETHQGVLSLFGEEIILTGNARPEDVAF